VPSFVRTAVVVVVALASSMVVMSSPPAVAAPSGVTLSVGTATGGADYAAQTFSDVWDYSNAEDQPLVAGATIADMTQASMSGGRLIFDALPGGYVSPLVSWDDAGALPWGRDGALYPVDANRYRRVSIHMKVGTASRAELMWFTCGVSSQACQGGMGFNTTAGWHTYDMLITNTTGAPAAWQGLVKGLRLYTTGVTDHVEIDWIRVYAPGQTATVTFTDSTPGTSPYVIWDLDADAGNNTTANPAWGRLDASGSGSTRTFHAGALPQGTYRIGVVDDGQTSYAPTPLVVDAPPAPVVIDPDSGGGYDYATLAGNAWDFNDAADVARVNNAASAVANGLLYGHNSPPLQNDPHVILTQYGVIDATRFHRLRIRMGHEGAFSLADAPGAGMNSRIIWATQGDPAMAQVSDDLVVYPGWHTFTLDLASSPPNAVQEPGTPGQAGWTGQQLALFRIDPNEDRGDRQWYIDDVRLAEDDTGYGGAFDIRFLDLDWQAGTTATLRADTDRAGCDGAVVAQNVSVAPGVNTVRWTPSPLVPGTYWVCLTLNDGRSSSSSYATGPLVMTPRPTPYDAGGPPIGVIDRIDRVPGGINVSGWALDLDVVDPIDVHVYIGGYGVATRTVFQRPDIANAYPAYGATHGFSVTLPAAGGTYDVCAYAINVGRGSNSLLGCHRITIESNPFGVVDALRQVPGGVRFDGWALDLDTSLPIDVHAYAGSSGVSTSANLSRGDIAAAFPGYGAPHGFSVVAPVNAGGVQSMCAYGISMGPGANSLLACHPMDVRVSPWGALDLVQRVPGGVRVAGWAVDPSSAESLDVHVYVGGAGTGIRADTVRTDLLGPFPEWGSAHGYDRVLPVPAEPVEVCTYGINVGLGHPVLLGCRVV
jgi:hypothetical protein